MMKTLTIQHGSQSNMSTKTAWVIHHSESTPSYNSATMLNAFASRDIDAQLINYNALNLANNNLILNDTVLASPDYAVIVNQTHTLLNSPSFEVRNSILEKLQSFENTTFANLPRDHAGAANKISVYRKLSDANISLPKFEFVDTAPDSPNLPYMVERIGNFPIVVKWPFGFEGMAVRLCHDMDELKAAIQELKAAAVIKVNTVILQEYVSGAESAMFCVRVIGDDIFTRMFLGSPYGTSSFKSIVSLGRQQLPCETIEPVRQAAMSVMSILNLNSARMDMFLTDEGIKICDVNCIGSFLPTDQTHNIRVADLIADMVIKKKDEAGLITNADL